MQPEDFRALFYAALGACAVGVGQFFAIGAALGGGSLAASVVPVVLATLAAFAIAALAEPDRLGRVAAATGAAVVVWGVPALVGEELWIASGYGLNYAAAAGVGTALALGFDAPARVATRVAAVGLSLALVLLLERHASASDVGFFAPSAAVLGVGLVDVSHRLAVRSRFVLAAVVLVVPVAAVVLGLELDERSRARQEQKVVESQTPPPARVGRERIAWTFRAPSFNTGPLLAGDVVVVDAANGVVGLDGRTGRRRWRARIPGRTGIGKPLIDGDLLLYPANLAGLYALDAETGKQRWRSGGPDDQFTSVAASGTTVVAVSHGPTGARVSGWRRRDGRMLWSKPLAGDVLRLVHGAPAPTIFAGPGYLRVETTTGRLVPTSAPEEPYTYGDFSALRSREHGWKYRAGWDASTSAPIEVGGIVYVNVALYPPKLNGGLYALDAETGKLRWRVEITGDPEFGPAVGRRHAYVVSRSMLYAIRL